MEEQGNTGAYMVGTSSDPLLTVTQVAKMFIVTEYTVRKWLKDGRLKGSKPTGQWRIRQSEADRFARSKFGDE